MKRFFAVLLLVALATVGYSSLNRRSRQHQTVSKAPAIATFERRPVYPLSIVPGGIRSMDDLKRAMLNDVVARNFSGFDMSQARFQRLAQSECNYVSFRGKRGVAWTRHCVLLPAGELVLTDGRLRFRTKCGNRISKTRQAPTSTVDTSQMEIPLPDSLPVLPAPPVLIASETVVPLPPGETPIVGPPSPPEPVCCVIPIGLPPIVPVGGPPIGPPRIPVEAGDDWKVVASAGMLLLVIVACRRRRFVLWK